MLKKLSSDSLEYAAARISNMNCFGNLMNFIGLLDGGDSGGDDVALVVPFFFCKFQLMSAQTLSTMPRNSFIITNS